MQRVPRCVAPGLLVLALGAGWGCGTSDIQVLLAAGAPEAGVEAQAPGPDAQASAPDAQAPAPDAASPGTQQQYCNGTGPPVLVETATDGTSIRMCPDQLAQRAFRYALCACGDYVSSQALVTDAFDGSQGAYGPLNMTAGGSVGVNKDLHPGPMTIGGSLWASSTTGDITTTSSMVVAGDLHAQIELRPASLVVQGDAWLASGLQASGDVTVKGTVHVPAMKPTDVAGTLTYGAMDGKSYPYAPACDCSHLVDIASVVRTYEAQNDDDALHIDSRMLENVQPDGGAPPPPISLPCGRIFLTRIGGNAPIHLIAQGRVAIFVQGDLSISDFQIDVPTGTELDLFVGGSINVRGAFLVGDPSNPARARTYVGGSSVNLQSQATLAGNLYAPAATITLGGNAPTTLFGSIFAATVSSGSDLTIHFDKAILAPSSTPACATPPTCSTCNDCNGQACNSLSQTCVPCADSTQCCAPLVCNAQGACVVDVIPR
jgi:hypothetical protein